MATQFDAQAALSTLLNTLQLTQAATGIEARIRGGDFPEISPHRLGTAAAVSLAALGTAVSAVWRSRGGRAQSPAISTARALQAIRSVMYVEQNGHPIPLHVHAPLSSFNRTKDGRWIYVIGLHTKPHFLDAALELLDCANTRASVAAAVGGWNALELEEALAAKGVPAAVARTREEWRAHPHGRWLAAKPVVEIERIGDAPPRPLGPAARPLAGLRVLDMTHVICGPMTGRCFAEHGADVLHVSPPHERETEAVALDAGWGKRWAWADARRATDAAQLRELAKSADFLIQSWRPGALSRLGFSPEDLARTRPGIIYVSVSCFGADGPWGGRRGYDPIAQAVSGMAIDEALDGRPRQPKTPTTNDYLAAYLVTAGALSALLQRSREGGSWHVKVSLTRSSMWTQDFGMLDEGFAHAALPWKEPIEPEFVTAPSPFGMLRALKPPIEYPETPARWDRPPEPQGASKLEWLSA